jgi:enoyl-CoA hydratase/carnithine racemase
MRFSTPDCRLSIMESRWGLIPDMGASITLRELVRMDVAKELTMTGRIISGTEAERIGLVTRCVDDPMAEAMKVAMEIVERYVRSRSNFRPRSLLRYNAIVVLIVPWWGGGNNSSRRSPDSVAATKELFQSTWVEADEKTCLAKETDLQTKLIGTWNQIAASGRQLTGVSLPYFQWKGRS